MVQVGDIVGPKTHQTYSYKLKFILKEIQLSDLYTLDDQENAHIEMGKKC